MSTPLYKLSEELLDMIVAEVANPPPLLYGRDWRARLEWARDTKEVTDSLRSLRLSCKLLARHGASQLFRSISFSTDPASWVCVAAVSKSPSLAPCVRQIVYRACVYDDQYDDEEEYAYALASAQNQRRYWESKRHDPASRRLGDEPNYADELVHKGFSHHKRNLNIQRRQLAEAEVDADSGDSVILTQAFQRLPSLCEFVIANTSRVSSHQYTFCGIAGLDPEAPSRPCVKSCNRVPSRRPLEWNIRKSGPEKQESIDILPLRCSTEYYAYYRPIPIHYEDSDDEEYFPPFTTFGHDFDQFALLKFRALRLLAMAAQTAKIMPLRLSVDLDEGFPLALNREIFCLGPLLSMKPLLQTLMELRLNIRCLDDLDLQFLETGSLGRILEGATQLQRIWIVHRNDVRVPRYHDISLNSIFGNSTFSSLRLLCIDGVVDSGAALLNLLSRHGKTLRTLMISCLAAFHCYEAYDNTATSSRPKEKIGSETGVHYDTEWDKPGNQLGTGDLQSCYGILRNIGLLELPLSHLEVTPTLRRSGSLEPCFGGGPSWDPGYGHSSSHERPYCIKGESAINTFLTSGGMVLDDS